MSDFEGMPKCPSCGSVECECEPTALANSQYTEREESFAERVKQKIIDNGETVHVHLQSYDTILFTLSAVREEMEKALSFTSFGGEAGSTRRWVDYDDLQRRLK